DWSSDVCSSDLIDIFEDLPGSDTTHSVGGFHQIVSGNAAMLTPQRVGERQWFGQLPGTNQEAGTVNLPFACRCHALTTLGGSGNIACLIIGERVYDCRFNAKK